MEKENLTTEDLNRISEYSARKESEEHYTERPIFHRLLAWALLGIVTAGIILYCYWLMVPQQ